jgi:hypothetical protein
VTALSSFHPAINAGRSAAQIEECSAHYFELSGSTIAAARPGAGSGLTPGTLVCPLFETAS